MVHTVALVLPTIIINLLDSGIANFIAETRVNIEKKLLGSKAPLEQINVKVEVKVTPKKFVR